MNWILLIIGGLFETGFATCLGKAQETTGRESYFWWGGFVISLFLSMFLLYKAISVGANPIPIGTAYAVWTGIGAVGAVFMGMFLFNEPATFWRMFFVFTLIASVVGLKVVSN